MPDGPPAPVTRTRGGSADIERPPRGSSSAASRGAASGRRVAVAHDLERLDVARLARSRPQ